jgi:hypothetical protein
MPDIFSSSKEQRHTTSGRFACWLRRVVEPKSNYQN